jgi:hypothetical protein
MNGFLPIPCLYPGKDLHLTSPDFFEVANLESVQLPT